MLTKENLALHDQSTQSELQQRIDHIMSRIQDERTMVYNRAMMPDDLMDALFQDPSNIYAHDKVLEHAATVAESLTQIDHLYHPSLHSNSGPMDRFLAINTTDEPNVAVQKPQMEQLGIQIGSMNRIAQRLGHHTHTSVPASSLRPTNAKSGEESSVQVDADREVTPHSSDEDGAPLGQKTLGMRTE